jgi:hypothetical protein
MNRLLAFSACPLFAAVLAGPALAEPPPVRFAASIGAFVPKLDTKVRLDSSDGELGVDLDFEESFNLDDLQVVPLVALNWHITKKHGLSLAYFDLQRDSTGVSTISFRFGDETFPADVPLAVSFDTRVFAVTYVYKLFNNRQSSFGFNFGLNVNEIKASIAVTEGPLQSESGSATAPLPTVGVNGHVMLSRKWVFFGSIGLFALSLDEYDGVLWALQAGFRHDTFKHVGFGVGFNGFNVRVDSENEDFLGRVDYAYNGVTAYLVFMVGGTG